MAFGSTSECFKEPDMMDCMFIGLTLLFGLVSWAFIVLCSKV